MSATITFLHDSIDWAKHRLDEMDAGLTAMDAHIAEARVAAHTRAAEAAKNARAWRDAFATLVKQTGNLSGVELKALTVRMEESWAQFEAEMENWAVNSERTGEAYAARANALLATWREAAKTYDAKAKDVAGAQKEKLTTLAQKLERDASAYADKFHRLQNAGALSWMAVSEALRESRQAFENAAKQARVHFTGVLH
jgi:hypothetical protein